VASEAPEQALLTGKCAICPRVGRTGLLCDTIFLYVVFSWRHCAAQLSEPL